MITIEMPLCRGTVGLYLDCTHCYYCGIIRPPSAELPLFCCLLVKPNEEVNHLTVMLCVHILASSLSVPVLCSQTAEHTNVVIVELCKTFMSFEISSTGQ